MAVAPFYGAIAGVYDNLRANLYFKVGVCSNHHAFSMFRKNAVNISEILDEFALTSMAKL